MRLYILTIFLALTSVTLFSQNLADSIKYQSIGLEPIDNIGTIGFLESQGKTFVYNQKSTTNGLEICLSEIDNLDLTLLDSCSYIFNTNLIKNNSLSNAEDIDNDGDQDIVLVENGEFDLISKVWIFENISNNSTVEFNDPYLIPGIDIFVSGYPSFVNLNDDEFVDIIISDLHGEITSIINNGDHTFSETDVTIENLTSDGVMNSFIEFSHFNESYLLKFNSKDGFNLFQYDNLIINPLNDSLFKFHYIDPVRNKFFQMSLLDRTQDRDILLSSIFFDDEKGYSTHYYLAYGIFNDAVDNDNDGFTADVDCDDNNPEVNPDQTEESYNGIDDDCNPATLDDDLDQDGFVLDEDCDDSNSNINPDEVEEPYNGLDDDCNPQTPDDDLDQDGFVLSVDCNDNNPDINPGAQELCNNIDDNCNNIIDEGLVFETYYIDDDGDGFGNPNQTISDCTQPQGTSTNDQDCDDSNPNINPNATDIPDNSIDEDCNGEDSTEIVDNDGDGFGTDVDCDDNNPEIYPGQTEEPYNGLDDDCDLSTLDDDLDEDGFVLAEDCDDNNPDINPDAEDIPNNGIDEDCDGEDFLSSTHELANSIVSIYPNPTIDVINIDVIGRLNYNASLYNLEGKQIRTISNSNQITVEDIPQGIYLLEIKDIQTGQKVVEQIIIGR